MVAIEELEWVAKEDQWWEGAVQGKDSRQLSSNFKIAASQRQVKDLYDDLSPSLLMYLRGLGLTEEESEDAVQEAFLRLVRHLADGGNEDNLRSWTFKVARNLSMDVHRTRIRSKESDTPEGWLEDFEPVDGSADPERALMQEEERKRLNVAMEKLTQKQRSSVLMRAEGLRFCDIASALGVSEQRAIHLVKRGLKRLTGANV